MRPLTREAVGVLAAVLLMSPSIPAQGLGEGAAPEVPKDPEFKDEKSKTAFAEGKESFAKGEYRDASKSFQASQRGAKSGDDKETVREWIAACRGGEILAKVLAIRDRGLWNEAYKEIEKLEARYKGTPLEAACRKASEDLERQLFHVLESFDVPNEKRYSEDRGVAYINDPKLVADGTPCIEWKSPKERRDTPASLPVPNVPLDWTEFEAVEFWVRVKVPARPDAIIITEATGRRGAASPAGGSQSPYLMQTAIVRPQTDWQLVSLDIRKFKEQGGATLEKVKQFQLQVPVGKSFDLLVDEFRLRRKNPSKEKGSTRRERRG